MTGHKLDEFSGGDAIRLKTLCSLATVVRETNPLQRTGVSLRTLCPFHAERTPSFHVYIDHYYCFGCGAHGDVFTWLKRVRGLTFPQAIAHLGGGRLRTGARPREVNHRFTKITAEEPNVALACRIWTDAIDPCGTLVESYLFHRNLRLPDMPVLRFHPDCPQSGGLMPAMIGLMTDALTGQPCGIHRTFLDRYGRGKACVDKPKMMLGRAGIIRLSDASAEGLGLAEGIETALAVIQRIGWGPVWAAGSANGIRTFPIISRHCLSVFADADDTGVGLLAARACATRWARGGQEAHIHIPPRGRDWFDATELLAV